MALCIALPKDSGLPVWRYLFIKKKLGQANQRWYNIRDPNTVAPLYGISQTQWDPCKVLFLILFWAKPI